MTTEKIYPSRGGRGKRGAEGEAMMDASLWDTIRAHVAAFLCTYPEFSRWLDRNQLDIGPDSRLVRMNIPAADRHLCVVIGRWKLENWHLYRYTEHRNVRNRGQKARWMMWDRVL